MSTIKVIVGLGNPGKQFEYTRHNIGFLVVDALVHNYNGTWHMKDNKEVAEIYLHEEEVGRERGA